MIRHCLLGFLLLALSLRPLTAQLAITEVMAESAVNFDTLFKGPDYWELTNFGTNAINLDGYSFADNRKTELLVRAPFVNLVIQPDETIIFFRAQPNRWVTNAAQFREWWGEGKIPDNTQFRTYESPGLDGDYGDELWVYDSNMRVVDCVKFGKAIAGRSFAYEPDAGTFGTFSLPGLNGAVKGVLADDAGSPGTTPGMSPLRIVQQPTDAVVDAGGTITLEVVAAGMPQPKYQWFAQGLVITGANAGTLTLTNTQPSDAGVYHVLVTNGLAEFTSEPATLTVNTTPNAPTILAAPADTEVFVWQTAVFSVRARGYPSPSYQWQANDVDIPGATNATLAVRDVIMDLAGTRYSVRVWNALGSTNLSARLMVSRRPQLRITEIMARPVNDDSSGHYDWFELTNNDTNTVDLRGYRLFDTPTFVGAFTITNSLRIRPGESVIFVEEMSVASFVEWWGTENLPANLQIQTFHGFALGDLGEALFLWNGAATDPFDTVTATSWAAATTGVSLECENFCDNYETYGCIGECLTDSIEGFRGAYRLPYAGDVGSPGYLYNPPPRIVSVTFDSPQLNFKCRVSPGLTYRLEWAPVVSPEQWMSLGLYEATDYVLWLTDPDPGDGGARFYRLEEVP